MGHQIRKATSRIMSTETQAQELIEAYDPMWDAIMQEVVLHHIPEREHEMVKSIMRNLRVSEVTRAMKYNKHTGNPRRKAKFLAETKMIANSFADGIKYTD